MKAFLEKGNWFKKTPEPLIILGAAVIGLLNKNPFPGG